MEGFQNGSIFRIFQRNPSKGKTCTLKKPPTESFAFLFKDIPSMDL